MSTENDGIIRDIVHEVSNRLCPVCGQHIWIESVSNGGRFIRGILKQDSKPNGWLLCACGFQFEESKSKGPKQ